MNPQSKQPTRESRAIWAQRYHQWQTSGLSKADFCKQHGIKTANFYFWCAEFRKIPPLLAGPVSDTLAQDKPAFVPVTIRDSAPLLTLQCGDVTLSCSAMAPAEQLMQWIKALRTAVCSQ